MHYTGNNHCPLFTVSSVLVYSHLIQDNKQCYGLLFNETASSTSTFLITLNLIYANFHYRKYYICCQIIKRTVFLGTFPSISSV